MNRSFIRRCSAIILAAVLLTGLSIHTVAASSSGKVYLPTQITAYDYVNGKYKKAGTETLRYNARKRLKSVKNFSGKTQKIKYSYKKGSITEISGGYSAVYKNGRLSGVDSKDSNVKINKYGFITSVNFVSGDEYLNITSAYQFNKNGDLRKEKLKGTSWWDDDCGDDSSYSYAADYNSKGFISSYQFFNEFRSKTITKNIFKYDKKGRVTRIIIELKDSEGNYVIVGKYELSYKNSPATKDTDILRGIINNIVAYLGYGFEADIARLASAVPSSEVKCVPANLTYSFKEKVYSYYYYNEEDEDDG